MNLSCLFGHSYIEQTYNLITQKGYDYVWLKNTRKICKCCGIKKETNSSEIKTCMWVRDLSEYFYKNSNCEYEIDLTLSDMFDFNLRRTKECNRLELEREKARISKIEVGPYIGIPRWIEHV